MSLLNRLKYYYFRRFMRLVKDNRNNAVLCQERIFSYLLKQGAATAFGNDHRFSEIHNYADFKKNVPVRNYEDFSGYIGRIFNGDKDVLWPGVPSFFGKSSGTVSGIKYIPVTDEYLASTQYAARYMIANLLLTVKDANLTVGKVFYQADAEVFETRQGFKCASISAIKSYRMPKWAGYFSLPPKKISAIEDILVKEDKTIEAILNKEISMAVALPVWLLHFLITFEKKTGRKFKTCYPSFKILFLSGMNHEPYEQMIRQHIGEQVLLLENYTATEGNFAYQYQAGKKGMELICNQGIFYEFIPLGQKEEKEPERIQLGDVTTGQQYILLISNNSGLWAYRMNDIVEFVSVDPYRLVVSGRLNDIFSPFGEQLLPIQAEQAMAVVCKSLGLQLIDFTIIPEFNRVSGHRYICYAEFENEIEDTESFSDLLHEALSNRNIYYDEFNRAGILVAPSIIPVRRGFFQDRLAMTNKTKTTQQKNAHLVNDASLKNIFNSLHEKK